MTSYEVLSDCKDGVSFNTCIIIHLQLHKVFIRMFDRTLSFPPEKDQLLVRNAELSQHHESYRRATEQDKGELQQAVKDQENAIAGLEQSLEDQQSQIQAYQRKVDTM